MSPAERSGAVVVDGDMDAESFLWKKVIVTATLAFYSRRRMNPEETEESPLDLDSGHFAAKLAYCTDNLIRALLRWLLYTVYVS